MPKYGWKEGRDQVGGGGQRILSTQVRPSSMPSSMQSLKSVLKTQQLMMAKARQVEYLNLRVQRRVGEQFITVDFSLLRVRVVVRVEGVEVEGEVMREDCVRAFSRPLFCDAQLERVAKVKPELWKGQYSGRFALPTVLILYIRHSLPLDRTIPCEAHHSADTPTDHVARDGVLHCLTDYLVESGHFHVKVEDDIRRDHFKTVPIQRQGGSGGIEAVIHCKGVGPGKGDDWYGISGDVGVLISGVVAAVEVADLEGVVAGVVVVDTHEGGVAVRPEGTPREAEVERKSQGQVEGEEAQSVSGGPAVGCVVLVVVVPVGCEHLNIDIIMGKQVEGGNGEGGEGDIWQLCHDGHDCHQMQSQLYCLPLPLEPDA